MLAIAPKSDKPSSEKHVDDVNDSNTEDATTLKDSADYDIGDDIPYTLTFKLPEDYANYETYAVNFYDDMSAGLTYNDDAKIYYGNDQTGVNIDFSADGTKSAYTTPSAGTVYKASIDDLKTAAPTLKAGDTITIKYTAKLNSNAVTGSTGNPNQYRVEFSNNPNGDGKGTTPWDINIAFTYKAIFNKIDENEKALTGADFTLFKFIEGEGSDTYGEGESAKNGTWTDVTTLGSDTARPTKKKSASGEGETAVADSVFTFNGLDAGVYKLSEIATPAGYNKIDDIIFTINADHVLEADTPTLTSLTTTGGLTLTGDKQDGSVTSSIKNEQGTVLPSTGGIGTTIFYVLGAILVIGAGLVLVTKKRMGAEK